MRARSQMPTVFVAREESRIESGRMKTFPAYIQTLVSSSRSIREVPSAVHTAIIVLNTSYRRTDGRTT